MFSQFKMPVFYLNIFQTVIYSCDAKLNFHNLYSSLQCHMILQKSDLLILVSNILKHKCLHCHF